MENARLEMETNYFGTLAMCRAFAPILKKNGGGAIVNVLSVVSWFNMPMQATYCASKSAAWSLTKAVRFELRAQGTFVAGVYAGYIDTA
jgi:NAD(P)-dependent dehydrogenase (short-subunit alcohol dehydrogenase family)